MRISVYLGDDGVGGFGVKLPSRRPLGFELLAMSAPRRVEFHGEVFGFADLAAQFVERCELYS